MAQEGDTRDNAGLLTRRELLSNLARAAAGSAAVGVLVGGATLSGCSPEQATVAVDDLKVAEDDVVTLEGFTEIKEDDKKKIYQVSKVADLKAGSMLYSSDGKVAAVLCTGESANPLSTVMVIDLATGQNTQALERAVGHDDGFQIFDVACSSSLLAWVESNYLTGDWRVYSASLSVKTQTKDKVDYEEIGPIRPYDDEEEDSEGSGEGDEDKKADDASADIDYVDPDDYADIDGIVERDGYLYKEKVSKITTVNFKMGEPVQLDMGDASYDEPEIEAVEQQAYWIVQPAEDGERTGEDSLLKTSAGGAVATAYTSHGRFNGGIYASEKTVTVMPRADVGGVYYQLTALQGGSVVATQIMPRSFRPQSALYLDGAFAFAIPASYDYGGGIANVGTYYPMPNGQWLRLTRDPVTPPGFCNGWFFCKSGARTVFVDMARQRYFTVDPPSGSASYGDYCVAVGDVDTVYTYSSVDKQEEGKDERTRNVQVRRIVPTAL